MLVCLYTRIARDRIHMGESQAHYGFFVLATRLSASAHAAIPVAMRPWTRRGPCVLGATGPGSQGCREDRSRDQPYLAPRSDTAMRSEPARPAVIHMCVPQQSNAALGPHARNLTTASKPTKQLNSAQGKNPRPTSECAPVVILELQSAWELIRHVPVVHGSA